MAHLMTAGVSFGKGIRRHAPIFYVFGLVMTIVLVDALSLIDGFGIPSIF
jgi:hypothetical protein